jgi:hypothetical protein
MLRRNQQFPFVDRRREIRPRVANEIAQDVFFQSRFGVRGLDAA